MKIQNSIIILVKNEILRLPQLFAVLNKQKGIDKAEVIAIDSGSTDGSQEFLYKQLQKRNKFSMRLFKIKSSEFGHGKTRNFGVQKAKGKIIVFLVQDAIPKESNWLRNLTKPLNEKKVVGVFGRQIPYEKTSVYEKFFYLQAYPSKNRHISIKNIQDFSVNNIYFSNCNGAIKTEFLKKYPFQNNLIMSEDQWWAWEVLKKGYEIEYRKDSPVYHSHNYYLTDLFRRQFISGYSLIGFPRPTFVKSVFYSLGLLWKETLYILKNYDMLATLGMLIYESIRYAGFILGNLGNYLPLFIIRQAFLKQTRSRKNNGKF